MNRSGVSNSSANSHQWKCPARYRTSVRAKILAPSRCSSQRGFVSMWHKLLRYLERKIHQFFFARPARDNLRFGKRRLRIKIRAAARIINQYGAIMATTKGNRKQSVTIRLDRKTIQSAKILAARCGPSLSALLTSQIERLVGDDETYERSKRQALAPLDQGFNLGGKGPVSRDELQERKT